MKNAIAIAAVFAMLANSAIAATPGQTDHTLTVVWEQDGRPLLDTHHVLKDGRGSLHPFRNASDQVMDYAVCTNEGNTQTLAAREKIVGRSLSLTPRSEQDGVFSMLVSASDTVVTDIREVGPADCRSQEVDIAGLSVADIPVTLQDERTVELNLDPHNKLRLGLTSH